MQSVPCPVCKEAGHVASACPTLYDPLKEGFYQGGGGGGQHTGEEEEKAKAS